MFNNKYVCVRGEREIIRGNIPYAATCGEVERFYGAQQGVGHLAGEWPACDIVLIVRHFVGNEPIK